MTVRELIEQLQQLDPDQEVRIDSDGAGNDWRRYYEISEISVVNDNGVEHVSLY